MRVCHIVPSLEERHGGPSKSVRALANAEARLGAAVDLLATQEPGQPAPVAGEDAARIRIFPREMPLRLCRSRELAADLAANTYDCVHNHALWLLPLHYAQAAAHRTGAPLVISPRGMFSGWAHTHRRARKWFAEFFVHPGAFVRAAGWHATSAEEADDIRRLGHRQPVCVAPNGVFLPTDNELTAARAAWLAHCPALAGRRVALFYSRFHRKKRVRELIDLWLAKPRGDWLLLLVGVPEEYSVAEINGWIAACNAASFIQVFDGSHQLPPFAAASLFLLPSHSENFGLVVAEALAARVPTLVTDTTPWTGLNRHDAGWCVSWDNYPAALDRALDTAPTVLRAMGERGRAWTEHEFTWENSARLLLDFYRQLSHG